MLASLQQTILMIEQGEVLCIAGDEELLSKLPKGNWIAGTTPYFVTADGGIKTKKMLYVNRLEFGEDYKIVSYDTSSILNIAKDTYENGVTMLLLPYASEVAIRYAKNIANKDILKNPVMGWTTGYDLDDEHAAAKAYDGSTGSAYSDKAVAMHVKLEDGYTASLGIINCFRPAKRSPIIEFREDALEVAECIIDGAKVSFYDYLTEHNVDIKLPLVAGYKDSYINVSIKALDAEQKTVSLFAPVFKGEKYRFAEKIDDYEAVFAEEVIYHMDMEPKLACNCILNYLHGNIEGDDTFPFEGPVTFGEIAYHLLNQTLVYLVVGKEGEGKSLFEVRDLIDTRMSYLNNYT